MLYQVAKTLSMYIYWMPHVICYFVNSETRWEIWVKFQLQNFGF